MVDFYFCKQSVNVLGCTKYVQTEENALKTVQKFSLQPWTLSTPSERHVGEVAEVV